MHLFNLVDPLLGGMVRRVGAPRCVVDEPRPAWGDLGVLPNVIDRLIRHRGGQVPAGLAVIGMNRRGVAEQVAGLPLAGIAADEAIEIIKALADRPIGERTDGAGFPRRNVMILAEPRGRIAVLTQDRGNRGGLTRHDRVVAGIAGRQFADRPEPELVMIAPGQQRRSGRRTQRRGVEAGVAQP